MTLTSLKNTNDGASASRSLPTTRVVFVMPLITAKDLLDKYCGVDFDVSKLYADYIKIDPTFGRLEVLDMEDKAFCWAFCVKVIYEVGPEARRRKKKDGDKAWIMKFAKGDTVKTVTIATYKDESSTYTPHSSDDYLLLTVKQAGIIAVKILNRVVTLAHAASRQILLTPLAGAIFPKDSIPEIGRQLGMSDDAVAKMMNCSCQPGGQHLEESTSACALVASIVAVSQCKDENLKKRIYSKTAKQYHAKKKPFSQNMFDILARYATSGVPKEISYEVLLQNFEALQKVAINSVAIGRESQMTVATTNVEVPHFQ